MSHGPVIFQRNEVMATATVASGAVIYCPLPGGKPRFMFSADSMLATTIVDAPSCSTYDDFREFVLARFLYTA